MHVEQLNHYETFKSEFRWYKKNAIIMLEHSQKKLEKLLSIKSYKAINQLEKLLLCQKKIKSLMLGDFILSDPFRDIQKT